MYLMLYLMKYLVLNMLSKSETCEDDFYLTRKKQTYSLYMKLPAVKPEIFWVFVILGEAQFLLILNLFISDF